MRLSAKLLFQIVEQGIVKEGANADFKTVAKLFDGRDTGV